MSQSQEQLGVLSSVTWLNSRLILRSIGYYNTWTEELYDGSELDEDATTTEAATTEDSVSDMSPGAGASNGFGASTGGLDFMSSSGYPHIEFGYDGASDNDEDEDEDDEDDESEGSDIQSPNAVSNQQANLVSLAPPHLLSPA